MASRQYKSIIRLFNHCGISVGDDFNLPRVKKQLQAEFRMAPHGLLEVDGFTYTQHEVFEELENPQFLQRLQYHRQLWESPEVLLLLEKNMVDFSTIREAFEPFWLDKEFDIFFSPYFAVPFNYLSRTFLAQGQVYEVGSLLGYEDFLQPAEREEAYRPIRIFLDENLRLLRNINKDNYKIIRPKIIHWIEGQWAEFFNRLPHEFYDVKVDIVTRLINIGVEIQKSRRRDCRQMSAQLVAIGDLPDHLRSIILSNHEAYNSSRLRLREGWWAVWIIIILIKAVAPGSCGNTYRDNRYDPEKFKIVVPDSVWNKLRGDTLYKQDRDSIIDLPH